MATTPNYDINYDDERFTQIKDEEAAAVNEVNETYDGLIAGSDNFYNNLIQASQDKADAQAQAQQDRTNLTIEQIEQQKEQTQKDYIKEQSASYVDWQKQSNQYGSEAEKMASAGLTNTGYSESSQVSMYNTYQNRVATAREVLNQAIMNYDNAIKDAQLQNSSILAEIAANAFQEQAQIALEGFQYKNSLIIEKANKLTEVGDRYHNRWLDMLNQMNTENAMAEEVRQFNENQAFQAEQAELDRKFQADQAEINRQHDINMLNAKTEKEKELLEIQHQKDLEKLAKQYEYDCKLIDKQRSYTRTVPTDDDDTKIVNTETKEPSIMDIGWGPVSNDLVKRCIAAGIVTTTKKNGKTYYNKADISRENAEALLKLLGY